MGMIKIITAQDRATTSTVAMDKLGELSMDDDGSMFRYVQAGAAVAQYDACIQGTGSFVVIPSSAANQVVLGSAQIACASGSYFWLQISGKATNKVVVGTAAGSPLGTNATAGTLALIDATAFGGVAGVATVTGVAAGSEIYLK